MDVKGKNVLVVGLGVSGYAAARLLADKGAFVKVTESADSEDIRNSAAGLSLYSVESETGGHTEMFCSRADLVVTSPGVPPSAPPLSFARTRNIPVIGELELGFIFCPARVIAVTGTNGKSTTARLIGEILSFSGIHTVVCGNIGNPLCGEQGSLTDKSVVVAEVSSFQLETIRSFRPYVAVLLNVAEDHYDRHGGFEEYKAQKLRIFENQTEEDWAVLNSSFEGDPFIDGIKAKKVFYGGRLAHSAVAGGNIVARREGTEKPVMSLSEIPLKGLHNVENTACSLLTASLMGVNMDAAVTAVKGFRSLGHRFELVCSSAGIDFIDDSKATNVDATRRALDSAAGKVVLIAGGRDKGGDYRAAIKEVRDKVKAMVLIGESRGIIKAAFDGEVPIYEAADMEEAVARSAGLADEGEAVMLSPMCSSFDMFSSYGHRGRAFSDAVRKYVSEGYVERR
jgi:UDP-N-acetylmuramoylalanine--D-glutamate ligase